MAAFAAHGIEAKLKAMRFGVFSQPPQELIAVLRGFVPSVAIKYRSFLLEKKAGADEHQA